ncbi:hypothetical protein [Aeromonas salmonicida]
MWQEIWKTVLSEFADIQDIQQMTQIVLRLLALLPKSASKS